MPLKPALNINAMDKKVLIESASESQNGYGEPVQTWSTLSGGSVWAEVAAVGRSEPYQADQFNAKRMNTFKIRHLSTVTEKMRLQYEGLTWDIKGIEHQRREGVTIITAECEAP